ncbi:MAG TPA: hypothetical protein VKH41_16475 [Myxococcota bacterium]|nr:hypothetical protein [Myxococcota bacterium]
MRAAAHWVVFAAIGVAACVSPGDPLERGEALKQAQHRYTEALRWGDLDKAARYVDPEMRSDFLALADAFETIRITDYDIGDLDLNQETLAQAEVDVTYRGYVLPVYVEKRVRDHQVWYRDKDSGNEWRVRPELAALIESIGAHR